MSSKSNALAQAYLDYEYEGSAMPTLGASLTVCLHTADIGKASSNHDAASLADYSGYANQTVSAWTRSSQQVTNDNAITFPTPTGDGTQLTHISVGDGTSYYRVAVLDDPITPANGEPIVIPAGLIRSTEA